MTGRSPKAARGEQAEVGTGDGLAAPHAEPQEQDAGSGLGVTFASLANTLGIEPEEGTDGQTAHPDGEEFDVPVPPEGVIAETPHPNPEGSPPRLNARGKPYVGQGVGGGRPDTLTPKTLKAVARMSQMGLTEREMRKTLGVPESTWRSWYGRRQFVEALAGRSEEVDAQRVERALLHRALGYSGPAEKVVVAGGVAQRVQYTQHLPPDPAAAMDWLTNRKGERWKRKQNEGPSGVTVVINAPMILDALAGREPQVLDAVPTPEAIK